MKAELIFGKNSLVIDNFIHSADDAAAGNPYNTVFYVRAVSGEFSGKAQFECDIRTVKQFLSEIKELYDFKQDTAELRDIDYGSRITLKLHKLGQLDVSGELYSLGMQQSVAFVFKADQSVLPKFIKEFGQLVQGN